MNMMDTLADRGSIEVTSIYGKDNLLNQIIQKEEHQSRQMLAEQLPAALATLTDKQKYAVTQYYCHGMKKNQIAKEMGISKVMAGRHVKAAIKKLRQFYGIENHAQYLTEQAGPAVLQWIIEGAQRIIQQN